MTPYSLVGRYQGLGGTSCLHFHGRKNKAVLSLIRKVKNRTLPLPSTLLYGNKCCKMKAKEITRVGAANMELRVEWTTKEMKI